jgi:ribosome-associated translation inhibitor RaiA
MRVEVFGNDYEVTDVLRTYAQSRVWLAVQHVADQVTWAGVRLMREEGSEGGDRVVCQIDVWLRGIGLVTVRHVDVNPYVGVECAAVRLGQAITRRLRESGRLVPAARQAEGESRKRDSAHCPRYAAAIMPALARPTLSLVPWLETRYGIDQVQTILLSWDEWDTLAAGDLEAPGLKRLRDRLALAQLCRPEAIVVVGGGASSDERPDARAEVERIAANLRSLRMPVEVIGVWASEHWSGDDCLIESEELPRTAPQRSPDAGDAETYAVAASE